MSTANSASAVTINGGFETSDFTGYDTIGDTSVQTSDFGSGPTEGTYQGFLSNASGVPASDLETFLGVSPGSLNGLGNGTATTGSAIRQTFAANAGDVLTFNYNFLTGEDANATLNDFSFFTING